MAAIDVLATPSAPRESVVDWPTVETEMRTSLPEDYKDFILRYGTGKIGEFIWVLNPAASNPNLNLIRRSEEILRALREYRVSLAALGKTVPFAAFPEPGGLLPWGGTDNGDVCYWRTGDPDPNEWHVVLNDGRGAIWEEFDVTMTQFIAAPPLSSKLSKGADVRAKIDPYAADLKVP